MGARTEGVPAEALECGGHVVCHLGERPLQPSRNPSTKQTRRAALGKSSQSGQKSHQLRIIPPMSFTFDRAKLI
jgi:hypothetical protein